MVSLFMGHGVASRLAKRVYQRTVPFLVGTQCPYIAPISAQNYPDFFVSEFRYFSNLDGIMVQKTFSKPLHVELFYEIRSRHKCA